MKKKIQLNLEKEIISDLSSGNLNSIKGGTDLQPKTQQYQSCNIVTCQLKSDPSQCGPHSDCPNYMCFSDIYTCDCLQV